LQIFQHFLGVVSVGWLLNESLLNYCYQVTYIHFQRGGASNDYPGMRIMSVLIPRNRLYELSPTIVTDGHHKVITAPGKYNYSTH
jgi:hypothetical protein